MADLLTTYGDQPVDGKYRILERLGSGGMGDVYKVEHIYLGAIRVIKAIRAQISGSADANERFLREARLSTRVQHPNVAMIHDFAALPDGSHYMVWEYIEGENLAQRIKARGTLPPKEAARIAIQMLSGLEAIHRTGVIHRDVSPENIMITPQDVVKIIDLGVAKFEDSDVNVTRTGIFVGKLRYASPEQLGFLRENEKIDARTDLYSAGMVLYEMLTGRPPFEGKSPHDYIRLHSEETSLQLADVTRNFDSDPALQSILRRALARDRNKRFQSAAEFRAALEQIEPSLVDANATMRLTPAPATVPRPDTLHRETLREAPPTLIAAVPQSRSRSRWLVPAIIGVFVILALAFYWIAFRGRGEKPAETSTVAAAVQPQAQSTPATTEVSVAPPPVVTTTTASPAPATTTVAPPVTHTVASAAHVHTETVAPTPAPVPVPVPRPAPAPVPVETPVNAYTEGGDRDVNGPLVDKLHDQVRGVKQVAVDAGAMQSDLAKALQHEGIEVADRANVTIKFDGVLEHLGRGRKRRAAHATILKNGRTIFRYELPDETYRVGDTPVEAFVNAVSGAFKD